MAISPPRPLIDPGNGNINLHGRGGAVLSISIQNATTGALLDISASALFFEIANETRIALTAGATATQRLLTITPDVVAALTLNDPVGFDLRDETNTPAVVLWSGLIRSYGFNEQPA